MNRNLNLINGLDMVTSTRFTKGVSNIPKKRNKSKRIQKKWIKKYGYKPIPDEQIYMFDGKIMGHPITIKRMLKLCTTKL